MEEAAVRAVRAAAEDLLGRAQRDAPVETGALRGSGHVEVEQTPNGAEAIVSFSTPYAAKQHEETSYRHPRGGRSKYLESNLTAMAGRYEAAIAAAVKRAMGS